MDNLKLRLLTNRLPLYAGQVPIYSPLLLNIADVGFSQYHAYTNMCCIGVDILEEKPEEDVSDFDVLTAFIFSQEEGFYNNFIQALNFFTTLNFEIGNSDENGMFFFYEEKDSEDKVTKYIELNKDNYGDFIKMIKFANCLKDELPEEELDEFDRAVLEAEKAIAEVQGDKGDQIPFKDMISAVCNMDGNGLSVLNIWDINIFSFYEQMKRGQLKEGYFLGIKQLLAGAEAKDVALEYYIQKTD